ncbi:MAG: hypothetical protein O7H39_00835 [Gammaproteobacteria bacterium]|nr:hypothetical protein [Gammaproteobacteria bacterium]
MTFRYGCWQYQPAFALAFADPQTRCAPVRRRWHHTEQRPMYSLGAGPMLGVRRPLRFLTWKLDLDDDQVHELAGVLRRLKTARAQAQVDWETSVADLADTFATTEFDSANTNDAIEGRKKSAAVLQDQVLAALQRLHGILDDDQRREFAYLLRSGGLAI